MILQCSNLCNNICLVYYYVNDKKKKQQQQQKEQTNMIFILQLVEDNNMRSFKNNYGLDATPEIGRYTAWLTLTSPEDLAMRIPILEMSWLFRPLRRGTN